MPDLYAHTPGARSPDWELLADHLDDVARGAADNAAAFGYQRIADLAGRLHDIGKCSAAFQAYLQAGTTVARGPDHSTAGAVEACTHYPGPLGRMLAFVIAGHHTGLADGPDLDHRLGKTLEPYGDWVALLGPLPDAQALGGRRGKLSSHAGFSTAFLIRMLFSCLVDADFIATERFYGERERAGFTALPELRARLQKTMADTRAKADPTPVNGLRADILDHALAKAALPRGLFTMTVPTGGGKTLASLSFALEHAAYHKTLRRVVFVIPYSSITEQTAAIYRTALAADGCERNDEDILEHHATFDWERAASDADGRGSDADDGGGRGSDPVDRLRRAAENWAAPVVVTTAVQFFESLFARRASRCRKLHNLANSVIVLDEAQTLPLHLLRPCVAALDELQRNYGASVVLCTATQPALRRQDGFEHGLDIPAERELAPDPQGLFTKLKRVAVERLPEAVDDAVIAARFAAQPQMLCIVNTRLHAQELFARIEDLPGAVHLSTLMCPAHRRRVLETARARLNAKQPVRIVSTSLIEAGVDIDLPEVWRAAAGAENIAQAAGRANREGKLPGLGRVVIFEAAGRKLHPGINAAWQAAREILRTRAEPFDVDGIRDYFRLIYWIKGADGRNDALDAATLNGRKYPILPAIADRRDTLCFPFKTIAEAFRMIDDTGQPVIVPWSSGPDDDAAETILRRVAAMDKPLGPDLRRLQHYTVSIPKRMRDDWNKLGVLRAVHSSLGEALLRFEDLAHYDPKMGVRLGETFERDPASN